MAGPSADSVSCANLVLVIHHSDYFCRKDTRDH